MKANGTVHVPSLTDDPEYAGLIARRDYLQTEIKATQSELDRLLAAVQRQTVPESLMRRGQRVAEILGDPEPSNVIDRSRIHPLQQRFEDLGVATGEIERRISYRRAAVSRQIAEKIKPEHDRRVHAICKALIQLHRENCAYRQLADALNEKDIAWAGTCRPMHPGFVGEVYDRHGRIANYLREAVEYCGFASDDIPDELAFPSRAEALATKRSRLMNLAASIGSKQNNAMRSASGETSPSLLPG